MCVNETKTIIISFSDPQTTKRNTDTTQFGNFLLVTLRGADNINCWSTGDVRRSKRKTNTKNKLSELTLRLSTVRPRRRYQSLTATNNYTIKTRRRSWECISPPGEFLQTPASRKILKGSRPDCPWEHACQI